MRGRRLLALLLLGAIVVACGLPPTSPSPSARATPATPGGPGAPGTHGAVPDPSTAQPSPPVGAIRPWTHDTGEIRGIEFGEDEVAYLFSWFPEAPSQLIALDREGAIRAGWPVPMGKTGIGAGPLQLADSSVVVLTLSYETGVESYTLHRVGVDGTPADGWPYLFPAGHVCTDIQPLASGGVVVACGTDEGTTVTSIDPNGDVTCEATTDLPSATQLDLATDGTIYATGIGSRGGVAAFDGAGGTIDGWPVRIPNLSGATLTADGAVLAWWRQPIEEICLDAASTTYLALDPSGTPRDGWPQTLEGYTSDPAVGPDGAAYVVTKRNEAFAFERDGAVRTGWPARLPGNTARCFGPSRPVVGQNGTLFVTAGGPAPDGGLTAIGPDGRIVEGWPFAPAGELAYPCRMGCTPGPAEPTAPIVLDDRAWIATYPDGDEGRQVEVLALDRAGRPIGGTVTQLAAQEAGLLVSPDDRLFAVVTSSDRFGESSLAFLGPAR